MRAIIWLFAVVAAGLIGILIGRSTMPIQPFEMTRAERDAGLDIIVETIAFDNMPIGDALNALHRQTGANLVLNRSGFASATGLGTEAPVTLRLNSVPLRKVLTLLAMQYDGAGFGVRDGVIVVSSQEDLSQDVVARLYDIGPFLRADRRGMPIQSLADIESAARDDSQSPQVLCATDLPSEWGLSREEAIEQLISVIQDVVDSQTWIDNGGVRGSMRKFGDYLVIVQTPEAHAQIEQLLMELPKAL